MKKEFETTHHLVPRQMKNKYSQNGTIVAHRFCHDIIHIIFTNEELAKTYNSLDALKNNKPMQKFIHFIHKGVSDFSKQLKEN